MNLQAGIRLKTPYRKTVGVAAVHLGNSEDDVHGILLRAICPGETIYIGLAGVTTATGYPMTDGESLPLDVRNGSRIYAIATAAAQSVAVLPFVRQS